MDYEIEIQILREVVIKHIEEVCGKLHPDGYYSTEYHVSSRNYARGHTVYALVGDRLERLDICHGLTVSASC